MIIGFNLVELVLVLLLYGQRVRAERELEVAEVRHALSASLRQRREACGTTQELVVQRLGVSRQAVSKWENGVSDPSTANLVALAELYGVDPTELIRGISSSKGSKPGTPEA